MASSAETSDVGINETSRVVGKDESSRRTLTTFFGVFVPVSLSMFSTAVFLRVGLIIGQAGFLLSLACLIIAYSLLVLTTLSICAISTNGVISGGGAYFMISRTLGPEFGGTLGLMFFFANIFSCSLYISGSVETLVDNFGNPGGSWAQVFPTSSSWYNYLYATCLLIMVLIFCGLGGSVFTRVSAVTLGFVVISILVLMISWFTVDPLCVDIPHGANPLLYNLSNVTWKSDNDTICRNYTGISGETFKNNLLPNFTYDYTRVKASNLEDRPQATFGLMFSLLFTSVTGIMNGANLSGELIKPSVAIPKGTFFAIMFTFVVYLLLIIGNSLTVSRELLVNYTSYLSEVNLWRGFIVIGAFLATFSASAGNLMGASRYLEALAEDNIFWNLLSFAKIKYKGNPIVSVLVSWLLVQVVSISGSLNAIAPVCTVCFLLMYGGTSLACAALDAAGASNFRPKFRLFHWFFTCLIGVLACIVVSFVVNVQWSAIMIVLMLLLLFILQFRHFPSHWGSISQALIYHQVRKYLLMLDPRRDHIRYWRPALLLMVSNPRSNPNLISFANDLKKGGLYILGHVRIGDLDDTNIDPLVKENPKWLDLIDTLNVKAFVELTISRSVREGFQHLVRLSGLGGMKPNTVVFGFYDDTRPTNALAHYLNEINEYKSKKKVGQWFCLSDKTSLAADPNNVSSQELSPNIDVDDSIIFVDELNDAKSAQPTSIDPETLENYFPHCRDSDLNCEESGRITKANYIAMLIDALKMNKNLVVCRNFENYNKEKLFSSTKSVNIDVWPVNPFKLDPRNIDDLMDTSFLFLCQMACILKMVRGKWRRHSKLRIFLVNTPPDSLVVIQECLKELRIQASEYISICFISDPVQIQDDGGNQKDGVTTTTTKDSTNLDKCFPVLTDSSLLRYNELVRSHSNDCGLIFMNMPSPPVEKEYRDRYLDQLSLISQNLPPTVLVRGVHQVTSADL